MGWEALGLAWSSDLPLSSSVTMASASVRLQNGDSRAWSCYCSPEAETVQVIC